MQYDHDLLFIMYQAYVSMCCSLLYCKQIYLLFFNAVKFYLTIVTE
jgi:hypothetical protein